MDSLDLYLSLVRRFPLRPIRTEAELSQAYSMLDWLLGRAQLDPGEQDYMDVLVLLIDNKIVGNAATIDSYDVCEAMGIPVAGRFEAACLPGLDGPTFPAPPVACGVLISAPEGTFTLSDPGIGTTEPIPVNATCEEITAAFYRAFGHITRGNAPCPAE